MTAMRLFVSMLRLACLSTVVLAKVVKAAPPDDPAYTNQGGNPYVSVLRPNFSYYSTTNTYPSVTPLASFIAARQDTSLSPAPTVPTPSVDLNLDACQSFQNQYSQCASATPDFAGESFSDQADCFCFDENNLWAGPTFDNIYTSCLNYFYTATPSAAWSSMVLYFDANGNVVPTPCEQAFALQSDASQSATPASAGPTVQLVTVQPVTVPPVTVPVVSTRTVPLVHVSAPTTVGKFKSRAAVEYGYLHGYDVLLKIALLTIAAVALGFAVLL